MNFQRVVNALQHFDNDPQRIWTFLHEFLKRNECSKMLRNAFVMFLNALTTLHNAWVK